MLAREDLLFENDEAEAGLREVGAKPRARRPTADDADIEINICHVLFHFRSVNICTHSQMLDRDRRVDPPCAPRRTGVEKSGEMQFTTRLAMMTQRRLPERAYSPVHHGNGMADRVNRGGQNIL